MADQVPNWSESSLRAWLADAVARSEVPGAALAIRTSEGVLSAEAGVLSIESGAPVTNESVFQIGSTTKVATAAILLQLVDEGRLELDEPIRRHLGSLPIGSTEASEVTVRQLLDHTSGLPGHYFADFGPGPTSIARYVESLSGQSMIHPPGAFFSYSNGGYVVAGRLAEVVTAKTHSELIQQRIAAPLDLRGTAATPEEVGSRYNTTGMS